MNSSGDGEQVDLNLVFKGKVWTASMSKTG